jgi:hypothetical protein
MTSELLLLGAVLDSKLVVCLDKSIRFNSIQQVVLIAQLY